MTPPNEQGRAVQGPASVDFPLVGIGASAGGLEALRRLLPGLPAQPGFSIVVVMHMAHDQPSVLAEVLQKHSRMPVAQLAAPRTELQLNHIYVIAPGAWLKVAGAFLLQEPLHSGHGTIDCFLHSLALSQRARCVGVLLSGLGHDGSSGLAALRAQGGTGIAQAPQDAQFDPLPQAAIDAGLADIVLPADEIAASLVALCGNASAESETQALHDVLALMHESTGHDFRQYRRPTILRRMENRQQQRSLPSLGAYRDLLQHDGDEVRKLLKDLLIGVTGFFRDREAFDSLHDTVLPALLQAHGGGDVRIWVAACSTGQEAYSLAMLLLDLVRDLPQPPRIQIFASDIEEHALDVARAGLYPEAISSEVPPAMLERYFVHVGKHYRLRQTVRDLVTFASHNLLRDPPFSNLDLVTCRNFLIYLDRPLQREVLQRFHFSLHHGGYLFLGGSETVDAAPGMFECIDRPSRLYRAGALAGRAPAPLRWPAAAGRVAGLPMDDMRERLAEAELGWEEMQSNNVKLAMLNAELRSRLEHAGQAHDDLSNLIASADLASVFVDPELLVKRYTPRAAGIFNLIARDVGRHLLDITHRLDYPQLAADVAQTFETLQPLEREVRASGGRHFIVRVRPYRTAGDAIAGAVLTFFDISARRVAEDVARELASGQEFLLHLGDCLRPLNDPAQLLALGCGMLGERLAVPQLSYAGIQAGRFALMDGYASGLLPLEGDGEVAALGSAVLSSWREGDAVVRSGSAPSAADGLARLAAGAGENGALLSSLCRKGQHWQGFFLACQPTARDWTQPEVALFEASAQRIGAAYERARKQVALRSSENRLRGLLRGFARAYWETDGSGLPLADSLLDAVHPDDRTAIMQRWADAVRSGCELDAAIRLRDAAGAWRHASMLVTPVLDEQGEVLQWVGCVIDGDEQVPQPSVSI